MDIETKKYIHKSRGAFPCCIVMTQSSSPKNSIPIGYVSISALKPRIRVQLRFGLWHL